MSAIDFAIFRKNLRKARLIQEISAKQLSIDLKLKQAKRISDIEEGKGRPAFEEVIAISEYFGQSVDTMMKIELQIILTK